MAAVLMHELFHAALSPELTEYLQKAYKGYSLNFEWNEVRAHAAEAFMHFLEFSHLRRAVLKNWDDLAKAWGELAKLIDEKKKEELMKDKKRIEELKAQIRELIRQIIRDLKEMEKIANKLRGLKDNLLKDYVKGYNPGNPEDPNCPLNQDEGKELKQFLMISLTNFLNSLPNFQALIQQLHGWDQLLKDLNLMLKCQSDVVPPIPGETGKIEGSKPEIPEAPEDAPKPVIEKGEEEIGKGAKDLKDGKKNFYLGPFLEVFSAFVNGDGVFELLLLHPELARDTSAVVSGNAHFCHFEGGAPGLIEGESPAGKPLFLTGTIADDSFLGAIRDQPDPRGLFVKRIQQGDILIEYEGTYGTFQSILEEIELLINALSKKKKMVEVRNHLLTAKGALEELLAHSNWMSGAHLRKESLAFDLISQGTEGLRNGLAAWEKAKGDKKLKERAERCFETGGPLSQELVVEARLFALHREIPRGVLELTLSLQEEGYLDWRRGDPQAALEKYREGWILLSEFGPDSGTGAPKIKELFATRASRPEITGFASPPLASVTLWIDGLPCGEARANDAGQFVIQPMAPIPPGGHLAYVVAEDEGGNPSFSNEIVFFIDTQIGKPVLTQPLEGSVVTEPFRIEGFAADPEATILAFVDDFVLLSSAGASGGFGIPLPSSLEVGHHRFYLACVDEAGNRGETERISFFAYERRLEPEITWPIEGQLVWRETSLTACGRGFKPLEWVELVKNDQGYGFVRSNEAGEFCFEDVPLIGGSTELVAVGLDASDEPHRTVGVHVYLHTNANKTRIVYLESGATVSEPIAILGKTDKGFKSIDVYLDNEYLGRTAVTASGEFLFEVAPLSEGPHEVVVIARSATGRIDFSPTVEFFVAD